MDNDLDLQAAFDALNDTVTRLHECVLEGNLGADEARAAITDLHEVDRVLQIIF